MVRTNQFKLSVDPSVEIFSYDVSVVLVLPNKEVTLERNDEERRVVAVMQARSLQESHSWGSAGAGVNAAAMMVQGRHWHWL